jgi:hypothetical protein
MNNQLINQDKQKSIYTFNYLVLQIIKLIKDNKMNNYNENRLNPLINSMEKLLNEIIFNNIIENKYYLINWLLKKPFLIDINKIFLIHIIYDCNNIIFNLENEYDFIGYTIAYLLIKITQQNHNLFPINVLIKQYEKYVQQTYPLYKFDNHL